MFKLCVLLLTICILAGTVDSGPLPDGQPKAIVVAIMLDGNGLKGISGSSSVNGGKNVDSRCAYHSQDPRYSG